MPSRAGREELRAGGRRMGDRKGRLCSSWPIDFGFQSRRRASSLALLSPVRLGSARGNWRGVGSSESKAVCTLDCQNNVKSMSFLPENIVEANANLQSFYKSETSPHWCVVSILQFAEEPASLS